MAQNICNICGANYEYKNGRWVCPACGAYKPEELSNKEFNLLESASQRLRLADFDDAEAQYRDIISEFPQCHSGYWGLVLAKYGIKYEKDYDGKMIPTCYAASYESVSKDKNYIKAIELADEDNKKYYISQAEKIEKIRKEWVEKASKEQPYDIFLSYKESDLGNGIERTEDSYDALEIYTQLQKLGYRVFFSRESLKDKSGENYEPYIFNALNTAKIMIVYGSKSEYIESTWIKNEWSRFYKRIKNGEKQQNALLVVFKGINLSSLTPPLSRVQGLDVKRIDFLRELEAYCERVIKAATTVLPKIERIEIKNKTAKGKGKAVRLETIDLNTNKPQFNEVKREALEKREIGQYTVPKLTAKAESELSVAKAYLEKGNFKDAEYIYDHFLKNNPKNGQALLGKLLAKSESKDIEEFGSKGVLAFSDWALLEQLLSFSDREIAEELLKTFAEYTIKIFKEKNAARAKEVYIQICAYDNERITEMREQMSVIAKDYIGTDNDSAKRFIDAYLEYENNDYKYLNTLRTTVSAAILVEDYIFAKPYSEKWLEQDGSSFLCNVAWLEVYYKAKTLGGVFETVESKRSFSEIDKVLNNLDESSALTMLNSISARIKALFLKNNYAHALGWIENFFKYKFEGREQKIRDFLAITVKAPSVDCAKAVDLLLSLSDLTTDEYNQYLFDYADNARKAGNFELAETYYKKSIGIVEDIEDWEGLLKCHIKVINDVDYPKSINKIKDYSIVENILSLLDSDDKRFEFVARLLNYCYQSVNYDSTKEAAKTFEKLLAYIPKGFDNRLIEQLFKFGRLCKSKEDYETAERLFATIINYDSESHEAYWELLQAKFKCSSENELASQPNPIPETDEFRNALLCAGSNAEAMGHYIDVQNRQREWIEADKRKKAARKKRIKLYKIASVTVAIASVTVAMLCLIVFAAVNIADYFLAESVLKFAAIQDGQSVYAGKYYKAEETLVIPSDSDGEPVTRIAAGAFKDHGEIKCVVIPYSVETIGDEAFSGCVNLESVRFAEQGEKAAKAENVKIMLSFDGDDVIKTDSKIKKIGNRAFYGCSALKEIELPYGLKTIGEEAFSETGLKEITIPETVEFVGKAAFENCKDLVIIEVGDRDEIPQDWDENWNKGQEAKVEFSVRVIFDYNGADEIIKSEQYVVYDKTYSFPVPVKKGYAFTGWHRGDVKLTDKNGDSLNAWNYQDGGTVKAEFTANENTVFFNGNGATSGETESLKLHTAESANLSSNGFVRNGYTFKGWATSANGTKVYDNCASYTMGKNSSYVLYAVWQANTNVLHFDANGGSGTMSDRKIATDSTITLYSNSLTRLGYTFKGWATSANGAVEYNNNANYTMGANAEYTLYAVWGINTYSLSYMLNGGFADNPSIYTVETDTFTLINPIRDGYNFVGWSGTDIEDNTMTVSISEGSIGNRSFTANWKANVNKVIFHANGGDGVMLAQEIETDATVDLSENVFTRTDCTFLGWAPVENGAVIYGDSTSYTMGVNAEYDLYAVWGETASCFGLVLQSDNTYSLTSINKAILTESVTIPSEFNGKAISRITSDAFNNCNSLTSVTIPDSVTSIGERAFSGCTGLTSVTIPNSVTSIGERVFYSCFSLTSVVIGNGVTSIGEKAFFDCISLTSLVIPDGVTSIGELAFYYCSSLTSVFYNGTKEQWQAISIGSGNDCLRNATIYYYYTKGLAYELSSDGKSYFVTGKGTATDTDIVIPSEYNGNPVTSIGDWAFDGCSSLTSVDIPDSVTSIGALAFSYCSSLTSVTIGDGVMSMGGSAFYGCSSLTSITIPDGVTSIGDYAFSGCVSLTSVVIPDNVMSIGYGAFSGCTGLTSVTIGDGVTSIGDYAFSGCSSLTSVDIPDSATSIGEDAFCLCTGLTSVNIGDGVTSIGDYAFYNCSSLTSITIPDSVTSIGEDAFYDCSSLTSVYYKGTEYEWQEISIGSGNECLTSATIYYSGEPVAERSYVRTDSDGNESANGEYILFGEYPQTIKADDVTITEITDSRGYYLGSDGSYYAALRANPRENNYIFSDNSAIVGGTIYYFKVEPIKWRILEEVDGTAILLCEMIIDARRFDDDSNNYAESEIRTWLNNEFYEKAFSALQKDLINAFTVDNSARSTNPDNNATENNNGVNQYACENTIDKVWLLSKQEVTKSSFGFNINDSMYTVLIHKLLSDYTRANYSYMNTSTEYYNYGLWWLRSPNCKDNMRAWVADFDGYTYNYGSVDDISNGVAPALQITL